MKIIAWDFYVDVSQVNLRYDMILGRDIFSELQIYLCFSKNTMRGNVAVYEVFNGLMKDVPNINLNASPY